MTSRIVKYKNNEIKYYEEYQSKNRQINIDNLNYKIDSLIIYCIK